jgi:MraZ protein
MTPGEEFTGTDDLTLDDRGRLAVPARYRHLFEGGAMLVEGPEGQVELWTSEGFRASSPQFTTESMATEEGRRLRRQRFSPSWKAELDRQGRVLVPIRLREYGALNGAVVLNGRWECLEVWNPQRWAEEKAKWGRPTASASSEGERR